ncbi:MAG TPA: hypothetical protein VM240_01075 [Verrucomicrobiae bacterium]|nr:hypothetical protein [Verrucomicrobiae bacterium]
MADEVPRPVSPEAVDKFVDDHCALAVEGQLRMRMPEATDRGLREQGFNRRTGCISPRTLFVRIDALTQFHALCGLRFDRRAAFKRRQEVFSLWESERALAGAPSAVPMTLKAAIDALMAVCGEDYEGRRDAALILLAARLSVTQIRETRCGDVRTGWEEVRGVSRFISTVTVEHPLGLLQDSRLRYWDEDAGILKIWIDLRRADGATDDDPLFPRRFTWTAVGKPSVAISANWVQARFRYLGERAGVGEINGRSATTMLALRKAFEHEYWDRSLLVGVATTTGMSLKTVRGYARRPARSNEDRSGG